MDRRLTIGQVAREAGVRPSAIRYYERTGLLPAPARAGGRREYGDEILTRLRLIAMAKEAGFSLEEVGVLLSGIDAGLAPSRQWQLLAERKLADLAMLVERIEGIRTLLGQSLECRCLTLEDCAFVNAPRLGAANEGASGPGLSRPAPARARARA